MKLFEVNFTYDAKVTAQAVIEAKSEKEAKEIFKKSNLEDLDIDESDSEILGNVKVLDIETLD